MTTTPVQLYGNLQTWQQKHNEATAEFMRKTQNVTSDELYQAHANSYLGKQDEIGYEFNFMEGKELTAANYNEQLTKLSQGEIDAKDLDGNGTISFDEYLSAELVDYGDNIDEATMTAITESTQKLYSIIDCLDIPGELTVDEFENFYTFLDQIQLDDDNNPYVSDSVDGRFNYDEVTEALAALLG